jgi:hypothetical protein
MSLLADAAFIAGTETQSVSLECRPGVAEEEIGILCEYAPLLLASEHSVYFRAAMNQTVEAWDRGSL